MNDWIEIVLFSLLVMLSILLLCLIIGGIYESSAADNTVLATLKADEWHCTETATKRQSRVVGKVALTEDVEVCIAYKHN